MQSLFALQNQMADEYEDNSQDSPEKEELAQDATADKTVER